VAETVALPRYLGPCCCSLKTVAQGVANIFSMFFRRDSMHPTAWRAA
jgi:hypothetical protein